MLSIITHCPLVEFNDQLTINFMLVSQMSDRTRFSLECVLIIEQYLFSVHMHAIITFTKLGTCSLNP